MPKTPKNNDADIQVQNRYSTMATIEEDAKRANDPKMPEETRNENRQQLRELIMADPEAGKKALANIGQQSIPEATREIEAALYESGRLSKTQRQQQTANAILMHEMLSSDSILTQKAAIGPMNRDDGKGTELAEANPAAARDAIKELRQNGAFYEGDSGFGVAPGTHDKAIEKIKIDLAIAGASPMTNTDTISHKYFPCKTTLSRREQTGLIL